MIGKVGLLNVVQKAIADAEWANHVFEEHYIGGGNNGSQGKVSNGLLRASGE